ncbi:MAG: hypothetical protein R3C56_40295 [Pirellulaceae bacterium]
MCLATAGARVVHVDASAPAVKWARANAEQPNRGVADSLDCRRCAKICVTRIEAGNHYDVIVLDPPSLAMAPEASDFLLKRICPNCSMDACNCLHPLKALC